MQHCPRRRRFRPIHRYPRHPAVEGQPHPRRHPPTQAEQPSRSAEANPSTQILSRGDAQGSAAGLTRTLPQSIARSSAARFAGEPASALPKLAEALLQARTVRNLRDLAMLLIGYAGGLRRSEVFALSVEDLERNADGFVR